MILDPLVRACPPTSAIPPQVGWAPTGLATQTPPTTPPQLPLIPDTLATVIPAVMGSQTQVSPMCIFTSMTNALVIRHYHLSRGL